MYFQLSSFGPLVGLIVVIHIAEQEALACPVNNQSDVLADAHREEIRVFGFVELVELQTWLRWIDLKVEGGRLDGLLFLSGQSGQTVGERVRDSEFHALLPIARFGIEDNDIQLA